MRYARDILAKKGHQVASAYTDQTVLDAAKLMNDRRIGCLVVTRGETVVGIFSERDILTRVVAEQRDPATTKVGEVMTTPCVVVTPDTELEQCQAIMSEKRIRHLPVVDEGRLVGIISSGDIMASQKVELEAAVQMLHEYIYGDAPGVSGS
ncbi:MAG: CBS domain-containing protein [Armatimonadota bacterium]|jgi:CBS domain-containing protein|nr:MAG: histidine kinase [Armatimonadota bacterium]